MSDLDSLKSKPKAKRLLKGVTFDFKGAHLTYTSASEGGAASLLNEPYLLKANEINKELTTAQQAILDEIGEESTPLDKNLVEDNNTPASSEDIKGVETKLNKGNDDNMSDNKEILKELQNLKRANGVLKVEKNLGNFKFDQEMVDSVSEALVDLGSDAQASIIKAMNVLSERTEVELTKAKDKSDKEKKDENPLKKALEKEEGHEAEAEGTPSTLLDKALASKEELVKGGK